MESSKVIVEKKRIQPADFMPKNKEGGKKPYIQTEKWTRPKDVEETMYTETEIRKLMAGYKPVKDLNRMTKGTFLRYWVQTDPDIDEYKFRKGGFLYYVDPDGKYIVLRNYNHKTWSVNLAKRIQFFYKPPTLDKIDISRLPKILPLEINQKSNKKETPEIIIKLKDLEEPKKSTQKPQQKPLVKKYQEYSNSYESDYSLPEEPEPKKKSYIAVRKLK